MAERCAWNPTKTTLERGVHRDLSSFDGYTSYRIVNSAGIVVGMICLHESMDCIDTAVRIERLWGLLDATDPVADTPPYGVPALKLA